MDYEKLKEVIAKKIKENGRREITGPVLQAVLMAMVDSLGEVYPHTYTDEQKAQARANIDALSDYDGEITKEKLSIEVQAILNDVANKQDITDASLATIAKTIVGAINEVYKGGLEDASIAASKIEDGAITEPKLDTDLVNVITSAVQPADLASAIADAVALYVAKKDIVATTGSATDKVMSQQGVTEAINGVTNEVTELESKNSQLGQDLANNTLVDDTTTGLPGTSIASIHCYVAGTTEIRSTTSNYWLYLYRIPKNSYYTIKKTSAPAAAFVIVGTVNSISDFAIGGNLSTVLVLGDDSGTVHRYYAMEDTYLVVLGNSTNEARYCTANLITTKNVIELLGDTNSEIENLDERVSFLDNGFELKDTLSFTRAWITNAGVIQASTNRVLSKRISGIDGVLSINTSGASSALDVIWLRILKGQTVVQAISSWLSDKSLTIAFSEEYDYYIEIRKHTDAALTLEEIANVKIYFDKGDIISCNHDAISRLANMRRPFHNYSYNLCLTLAYFSDIHADTENIRRMSEFYVKYKWGLDDILQTGDLIAGNLSEGVPSNWNELGANVLGVIGNHDAQNKEGSVWVTQPQKDSYDTVFAPWIANWGVTQPADAASNGYCYWYKDYAGQKIRIIALDCMHWDSTQKTWFESTLADAKTNQMSVIVAVHYLPFEISDTDVPFDSIDFHPTSQSGSFIASPEIPNAVADFIGNGGEFICYLTGHIHIDLFGVGVSPYGNQLCISIATASYLNMATIYGDTERKQGTKSQDCINIVSFDTRTKTVKLYRIGADQDRYMRKKDFLSYNYSTHTVIR